MLTLPKRKTDQEGSGTRFEIHDNQAEEPAILAFTKLKKWIQYR